MQLQGRPLVTGSCQEDMQPVQQQPPHARVWRQTANAAEAMWPAGIAWTSRAEQELQQMRWTSNTSPWHYNATGHKSALNWQALLSL